MRRNSVRKLASWASVAVAGVGFSGCTGSIDPATAGLFDNVANFSSGEYDRQIAAGQAEARTAAAQNAQAQQQIAALEAERSQNVRTIASLNSEIAIVRREANATRAGLAADPAANAARLQRLDALEAQIDGVQADANAGVSSDVVRRELGQIRSAIRALSS